MRFRKRLDKSQVAASDNQGSVAETAPPESLHVERLEVSEPALKANKPPRADGRVPELDPEQLRKMAAASKAVTAAMGEIVALLMRSPQYKHYSLADLEWLVVPALLTGQFSLATGQSKTNGLTAPVGVVLWASVSDDIDQRMSATPGDPSRLKPHEWTSGGNLWVVLAIGDQRVLTRMLKELHAKAWANKPAKLVVLGSDKKPHVAALESKVA